MNGGMSIIDLFIVGIWLVLIAALIGEKAEQILEQMDHLDSHFHQESGE